MLALFEVLSFKGWVDIREALLKRFDNSVSARADARRKQLRPIRIFDGQSQSTNARARNPPDSTQLDYVTR
jgi:hypothetical protein